MSNTIENLFSEQYTIEYPYLSFNSDFSEYFRIEGTQNFSVFKTSLQNLFNDVDKKDAFVKNIEAAFSRKLLDETIREDFHANEVVFARMVDPTFEIDFLKSRSSMIRSEYFREKIVFRNEGRSRLPDVYSFNGRFIYLSQRAAEFFFDNVSEDQFFWKKLYILNKKEDLIDESSIVIQPRYIAFVNPSQNYYIAYPEFPDENLFTIYDFQNERALVRRSWTIDDPCELDDIRTYDYDISGAYRKARTLRLSNKSLPILPDYLMSSHRSSLARLQYDNNLRRSLGEIPLWSLNCDGNCFISRKLVEQIRSEGLTGLYEANGPFDRKATLFHV